MISIDELEYRFETEFDWISHGKPELLSVNSDGNDNYSVEFISANTCYSTGHYSSVDEILEASELCILSNTGVYMERNKGNKMVKTGTLEDKSKFEDMRDERHLYEELDRLLFIDIQKHKLPQQIKVLSGIKLYGFDVWEDWTIKRYDAFTDTYVCTKENSVSQKKSSHNLTEDAILDLIKNRKRKKIKATEEEKLDFYKIMGAN